MDSVGLLMDPRMDIESAMAAHMDCLVALDLLQGYEVPNATRMLGALRDALGKILAERDLEVQIILNDLRNAN